MAAGCGGQDIKDPYGINLRSDPSPWCGARAAGPQWWSRRLPPAGSLKRSMALTTRVCLALSGGPQQLGHSTDHSDARLPDTIGNHPQHRCGPSDERLCSSLCPSPPPVGAWGWGRGDPIRCIRLSLVPGHADMQRALAGKPSPTNGDTLTHPHAAYPMHPSR